MSHEEAIRYIRAKRAEVRQALIEAGIITQEMVMDKGRVLPFIPLKPWQVGYIASKYPDHFQPDEENPKPMTPDEQKRWWRESNRLVKETDFESAEAKVWERVWTERASQ